MDGLLFDPNDYTDERIRAVMEGKDPPDVRQPNTLKTRKQNIQLLRCQAQRTHLNKTAEGEGQPTGLH